MRKQITIHEPAAERGGANLSFSKWLGNILTRYRSLKLGLGPSYSNAQSDWMQLGEKARQNTQQLWVYKNAESWAATPLGLEVAEHLHLCFWQIIPTMYDSLQHLTSIWGSGPSGIFFCSVEIRVFRSVSVITQWLSLFFLHQWKNEKHRQSFPAALPMHF